MYQNSPGIDAKKARNIYPPLAGTALLHNKME